jgi:hypothetical protein
MARSRKFIVGLPCFSVCLAVLSVWLLLTHPPSKICSRFLGHPHSSRRLPSDGHSFAQTLAHILTGCFSSDGNMLVYLVDCRGVSRGNWRLQAHSNGRFVKARVQAESLQSHLALCDVSWILQLCKIGGYHS